MPTTKSKRAASHGRYQPLPRGKTGGVQLLLIQSVDHLGKQGDVVQVKRGYALNYLLPQGLATIATDHHKRMVDKHKSRLNEIEKARLASLRRAGRGRREDRRGPRSGNRRGGLAGRQPSRAGTRRGRSR